MSTNVKGSYFYERVLSRDFLCVKVPIVNIFVLDNFHGKFLNLVVDHTKNLTEAPE